MAPSWNLVTYRRPGEPIDLAGALVDGEVFPLPVEAAGGIDVVHRWDELAPSLRGWSPSDDTEAEPEAELLAPLRFPSKILCAGANYRDHVEEMGIEPPSPDWEPWFFLKTPTTTVIGPGEPIRIDPDPEQRVDWEGELGVVIGRLARNVTVEQAPDCVAGFLVLNDVSARGPHRREQATAEPFRFDWIVSKSQDGFCPMGPGMVPAWFIEDPHDLQLRLWVNGDLKQDASTANLIQNCWRLVAGASRQMTLEPGDVIATGTPAGVGAPRGIFLRPGDEVVVEIEGVGRLVNPVEARQ